jgi:prevent-host-death family protein
MADSLPVSEARARLADLVARVAYAGEEFVLTRHGRPSARLVPAARIAGAPRPAGPAPEEGLARRLAAVGRSLWVGGIRRFAALGLFPGQERVLLLLWERDGRSQSELVADLGVEPATASKMLRRMERSGLVMRRREPGGRGWRVHLAARAAELREPVERELAAAERRVRSALTDAEAATLAALLGRVADALVYDEPAK